MNNNVLSSCLERRAEQLFHSQSDAGHVFESYRSHANYSTSASLQNLHYSPNRQVSRIHPTTVSMAPAPVHLSAPFSSRLSQSQSFPSELDAALRHTNNSRTSHRDIEFDRVHTTARAMTTLVPSNSIMNDTIRNAFRFYVEEAYGLSNGRTTQQRSTSASNSLANKCRCSMLNTTYFYCTCFAFSKIILDQDVAPPRFLPSTDLKHVRRSDTNHPSIVHAGKSSKIIVDTCNRVALLIIMTFTHSLSLSLSLLFKCNSSGFMATRYSSQ
jgi:hypothetical protein